MPASPLAGGNTLDADTGETGLGEVVLHLVDREAEATMSKLIAQEFLVVGVEIDHREPAARRQSPSGFSERSGRIVEEVQHLMDDHEIVGVALDGRSVDVALAQGDVAELG